MKLGKLYLGKQQKEPQVEIVNVTEFYRLSSTPLMRTVA